MVIESNMIRTSPSRRKRNVNIGENRKEGLTAEQGVELIGRREVVDELFGELIALDLFGPPRPRQRRRFGRRHVRRRRRRRRRRHDRRRSRRRRRLHRRQCFAESAAYRRQET